MPAPVEQERRRGSTVTVIGLIAVVVVALVLLSVWSFSPQTEGASTSSAVVGTSSAGPTGEPAAPSTTSAASTTTEPPVDAAPVFVPVTVLNSAGINGLAASLGDELSDGGWEIRTLGAYSSKDIATTTVYFTAGSDTQEQAAADLVAQFPGISGPVPRFFEIPDLPDPGIVVVATGSWRP